MERKSRERGTVTATRGELALRFYWKHPDDPFKEHRWFVRTHKKDTPENRELLHEQLRAINSKIRARAFFPCQEFPNQKIAAYCDCATCGVVEHMSNAHEAPRTLKELMVQWVAHEKRRASGEHRSIEASSTDTTISNTKAFAKSFVWYDKETDEDVTFPPLDELQIGELTVEAVKNWLYYFQHREERLAKGQPPNTTKYMNQLATHLRSALRLGQERRWWRTHPLLEISGGLLEPSKKETNERKNRTLHKPFSYEERERIIDWYYKQWQECSPTFYKGKEKLRRFFLYHYVVIGFNTGLRSPSEMTALQWDAISFTRQRIHVCRSREASGTVANQILRDYTKTVKHRYVPMNDQVIESMRALQEYRQEEDDSLFFNTRAETGNPFLLSNGWAPITGEKRLRHPYEKCLKELGIASPMHQGQYRMRHTFVTTVLEHTTLSDAEVAALIGDTVETMKNNYEGFCHNRWHNEHARTQLNELNKALSKKSLTLVKT